MAATSFTRSLFTTPSPKYDDFLVGNAAYNPSSFESIATFSPTSGTSISFTSIPSTYKSLQIRSVGFGSSGGGMNMQFNSDTATNYIRHTLYGDGSTVTAGANTGQTSIFFNGRVTPLSTTYGEASIIDIVDYANTSKNKTVRIFSGADNNGTAGAQEVDLFSGLWLSTAAISTITINISAGAFATGSSIALYGIKQDGIMTITFKKAGK